MHRALRSGPSLVLPWVGALLFAASGCNLMNCESGHGEVVRTPLSVSPFDRIVVQGSLDVVIHKGATHSAEVEGQKNLADLVSTEVINGTWTIRTEPCVRSSKPFVVHLTTPTLDAIHLQGSGRVEGVAPLAASDLDLRVQGSGDLQLEILSERTTAFVDGSGDILLTGSSEEFNGQVQGSGDLRAAALETRNATASVTGSGDLQVQCRDKLRATVTGSGSVRYLGPPAQLERHVTGSGTIEEIP